MSDVVEEVIGFQLLRIQKLVVVGSRSSVLRLRFRVLELDVGFLWFPAQRRFMCVVFLSLRVVNMEG